MKSYIAQTLILIALIAIPFNLQSQTLHALIVADSKEKNAGEARKQDVKHLMSLLNLVSDVTGYNLEPHIIEPGESILFGSNYDVPSITSLILGLKIEKEDIFFFYYTGHGTKSFKVDDPFARPHIKGFEHKYLSLQMVQKLIQISQPRLSIVMGNLCNTYGGEDNPENRIFHQLDWTTQPKLTTQNRQQIKNLFRSKGQITSTSSMKGTYSYQSGDGGYFTKCFINSFYKRAEQNGLMSWNLILNETKTLSEQAIGVSPYYEIEF
ncbi:MAG: caspase family protein [Bacteroidota bacterium]